MYVSSYNTYIQTNTSKTNEKQKVSESKAGSSFSSKLREQPKLKLSSFVNLPVDYISKSSKTQVEIQRESRKLQNPQDIEQNRREKQIIAISQKQTLQSAKIAYQDNSKLFSLIQKPQTKTIDQTPKNDLKLPTNIQELKEENMRRVMVNTYIQNDKYYKITA
jgi:type IV secretory pathway TraG/TraD family ATPase VirD4